MLFRNKKHMSRQWQQRRTGLHCFERVFRNSMGCRWLQFTLLMLIFELIIICDFCWSKLQLKLRWMVCIYHTFLSWAFLPHAIGTEQLLPCHACSHSHGGIFHALPDFDYHSVMKCFAHCSSNWLFHELHAFHATPTRAFCPNEHSVTCFTMQKECWVRFTRTKTDIWHVVHIWETFIDCAAHLVMIKPTSFILV